jgi:hypothetical protein
MTDDIYKEAMRLSDETLFGFSVIDSTTGERVDPRSIMPVERYALYGVIAEEHDENTASKTLEEQSVSQQEGETLIYETDDYNEARAIFDAGGFFRDDVWNVVTRVEDRESAGGGGAGPLKPQPSQALGKEDYQ